MIISKNHTNPTTGKESNILPGWPTLEANCQGHGCISKITFLEFKDKAQTKRNPVPKFCYICKRKHETFGIAMRLAHHHAKKKIKKEQNDKQ
jgi:hypothetical protein